MCVCYKKSTFSLVQFDGLCNLSLSLLLSVSNYESQSEWALSQWMDREKREKTYEIKRCHSKHSHPHTYTRTRTRTQTDQQKSESKRELNERSNILSLRSLSTVQSCRKRNTLTSSQSNFVWSSYTSYFISFSTLPKSILFLACLGDQSEAREHSAKNEPKKYKRIEGLKYWTRIIQQFSMRFHLRWISFHIKLYLIRCCFLLITFQTSKSISNMYEKQWFVHQTKNDQHNIIQCTKDVELIFERHEQKTLSSDWM